MVRLGMGVGLAFTVLAGCHAENFVSPDKPDLYKVPYDFAPALDLGGQLAFDLSAAVDSSSPKDLASPDLALPHDLSVED